MKCRASQSWRWPFAGPKKTSITVYTLIRVNKLATLVDRIAFGSFVKQVKNRRYQALQEPFDTLVASVLERLTSQPARDSDQATPLTSTPRPSRTLNEEVQFDRARVTSLDWSLYPILRFPEIPEVVVELIDRPEQPSVGAGEATTSAIPAAIANAIFNAPNERLRTIPFMPERVKAELA